MLNDINEKNPTQCEMKHSVTYCSTLQSQLALLPASSIPSSLGERV